MTATPSPKKLNILVFGAGAIGGYLGGSMALRGHRVGFFEQESAAAMLQKNGLRLRLPSGDHHIHAPTVYTKLDTALSMGNYDAMFFAVKAFHTKSALETLLPFAGHLPRLYCFQNGVDNEILLTDSLGKENVVACTVTTAIERPAFGNVGVGKLRGIGIAKQDEQARILTAGMNDAGLNVRTYDHAPSLKWSKLLTNLIANPLSAILDLHPREIFAHPGLFELEMEQLRETIRVMKEHGARIIDLPGTPVRALGFAAQYVPSVIARPILGKQLGAGRGTKMPSFHIELHRGSPVSEVEYLHGAVVRYGERYGVPTPVNAFLTKTLVQLHEQKLPLDTYAKQPDKLIAHLKS
jgi:2-dehydropantoate 2-reductase